MPDNELLQFENIENKDLLPVFARVHGHDRDGATTTLEGPEQSQNYGVFFIATRPYEVMEISEVHVGTSASGTLNIERLQGTEALDAGDEIAVADFSTTSAANTVVTKLGADLQNREIFPGDRLALKDGGSLTGLTDQCITVLLKPLGKGDYR